jgi:hypothetical protein
MFQVAKSRSVQSADQKCIIHFELLLKGAELDIVFMLTMWRKNFRLVFCRQMFLKYLTCLAKSPLTGAWADGPGGPISQLAKLVHRVPIVFGLVRD